MQHINLSKCTNQVTKTTSLYKEGKKLPALTVNHYTSAFERGSTAKQGNDSGQTPTTAFGQTPTVEKMPADAPGHQLPEMRQTWKNARQPSRHPTFPTRGAADLCSSRIAEKPPSSAPPPLLSSQEENADRGREG